MSMPGFPGSNPFQSQSTAQLMQTIQGLQNRVQQLEAALSLLGQTITLKTGSSLICLKQDGTIEIKGKDITISGTGKVNVKASSDLVLKGAKVQQN